MKRNISFLAFSIFSAALIFSLAVFLLHFVQQRKDIAQFEQLTESVAAARAQTPVSGPALTSDGSDVPCLLAEYAALYAENPDLWGWLKIDGTAINYPVMHTPKDAEYYLHRNFQREDSSSGTPFLDGACTDNCGNYIIYGHNMKNNTMFASLLSYADEDFFQAHPTIQLDTLYEHGSYSVVAAFYSRVYSTEDTGVFRYYRYTDLSDAERFKEFVRSAKAEALYDTGVEVTIGEQLLTLSTCSYHTENGRFVVVAKKS